MNTLSTFLFAEPSFTEGGARVLDMGGTLNLYNSSLTDEQADFWALHADWRAIGQDLQGTAAAEYQRLFRPEDGHVRSAG
jgi:hypothetical protein